MNLTKVNILERLFSHNHIQMEELFILLQEDGSRYAVPLSPNKDYKPLFMNEIYEIIKSNPEYSYLLKDFTEGQIKEITKVLLQIIR